MSFEEIISEIQKKPEIWMSKHIHYKNRTVKAKVWKQLAEKLGIQEDALKKRWKHLKDQYRKELKKQPVLRSGSETEEWVSSWQYFELMKFIKDEVIPAQSTGNLSTNQNDRQERENTETQNDSENSDSETSESLMSPTLSPVPSTSSSPQPSSSSRKRKNVRDSLLDIEKQKLLLMQKRLKDAENDERLNNDEDFLFLRSILPSIKKLTELQKFEFRGKVNEWLYEAVKQNQRGFPGNYYQGGYTQPSINQDYTML